MKRHSPLFLIIAAGCLLAGCETLEGLFDSPNTQSADVESDVVPLAERPRQDPQNRNYFALQDDQQSVVGEPQVVFTNDGDTFSDIAREYGLGYDELVAANPDIDPWLPGTDTPVLLPTQYVLPNAPRTGIVLNIAAKRLFYYPPVEEGAAATVMTYPIGIGRVGWETPLGETTVVSKARDPVWYVPASVRKEHREMGDPLPAVVPPGPDNPLGRHVLKLGIPGYLIHGTNQPYGVGMRVSHGCVRLYPENIELLYDLIGIGNEVRIVNQPYLLGQLDGELYMEAHAPLEDDELTPEQQRLQFYQSDPTLQSAAAQDVANGIAESATGVPIRLLSVAPDVAVERARIVHNTVERNPDEPTLDEIREMMDEEAITPDSEQTAAAAPEDAAQ